MNNTKDLINKADQIIEEFNNLKKDIKETKFSKKERSYNPEEVYNEIKEEMERKIQEIL